MHFVDWFGKKCLKMGKTGHFMHIRPLYRDLAKMTCFPHFSAFFAKQIHKMHKITSNFYDLRKFLT